MSSIATIMATAAFSVGAVAALRRLKARRRGLPEEDRLDRSVVDLKADGTSGVWRLDGGADPSS